MHTFAWGRGARQWLCGSKQCWGVGFAQCEGWAVQQCLHTSSAKRVSGYPQPLRCPSLWRHGIFLPRGTRPNKPEKPTGKEERSKRGSKSRLIPFSPTSFGSTSGPVVGLSLPVLGSAMKQPSLRTTNGSVWSFSPSWCIWQGNETRKCGSLQSRNDGQPSMTM